MVVGESNDHDGSHLNLAVDNPRLLLGGVHAQDSGLWEVDDGGAEERAKDTAVGAISVVEHMLLVSGRSFREAFNLGFT